MSGLTLADLLHEPPTFRLMVTGHRPHKLRGRERAVEQVLRAKLVSAKEQHPRLHAISGMAMGVDILFAETALALDIPVEAFIPFEGQEARWPWTWQKRWNTICDRAVLVEVVSHGEFRAWKLQKRNEVMCLAADACLAIHNGTPGGTANCLKYAATIDLPVDAVNPDHLPT